MAIISSYPTITPTSSDLVLVVDTSEDGNPTKTAKVGSMFTNSPVQSVQIVITSAELLSFNTYPFEVKLLSAPGPNKAIVALNAAFKMDYKTGPVYDFNQDLRFAYFSFEATTLAGSIPLELLNSGPDDLYATEDLPGQPGSPFNPIKVDSSFAVVNNGGTTVSQGTGDLVIDLLYRIVEFPS